MITIKSPHEVELMRQAGLVVYDALSYAIDSVKPGATTRQIDRVAEEYILSKGAIPSFKGHNGFPNTLCVSVDDEVVHGIPSDTRVLEEGSIVSLDCGAIVHGYHGDSAITVPVGKISAEAERLVKETRQSFFRGIENAIAGNRIGDVANAIQRYVEERGYSVVRVLCGHGIGKDMHEDPEVPNYGRAGHGVRLRPGMTIAVEPMINMGRYEVNVAEDKWTVRTKDGSLCSHYEHTIVINENGLPEILTLPRGTSWEDAR